VCHVLAVAAAKRRFWAAFRALGEWYAALPPQ
jgi:hypothetical protein